MRKLALFACMILFLPEAVEAGEVVILSPEEGKKVFEQCSRLTPTGVESIWRPDVELVTEVDTAISQYLDSGIGDESDQQDWGKQVLVSNGNHLDDFVRQYTGFTRAEKQFIYVNLALMRSGEKKGRDFSEAILVCDGGPSFWGVEFDVEKGEIVNVEFNGII